MTRLLYLPDDQTFLVFESPFDPRELMQAVTAGDWQPPAPYPPAPRGTLWAFQQGRMIVVAVCRADDAAPPGGPRERTATLESLTLSPRQRQVLQAMAEGLTSKQIAQRLRLHKRTVEMHIAALKTRLGTVTRAQTVGRAAALGLCSPPMGENDIPRHTPTPGEKEDGR